MALLAASGLAAVVVLGRGRRAIAAQCPEKVAKRDDHAPPLPPGP
ncbi:hypothetical protein AB4Y67_00520 [Arthrobacter sp. YAF17]